MGDELQTVVLSSRARDLLLNLLVSNDDVGNLVENQHAPEGEAEAAWNEAMNALRQAT